MDVKDILKALNVSTICPHCGKDILNKVEAPKPPVVPTVPSIPSKVFPHKITFENQSDEGYGNVAIILFPTLSDNEVTKVTVNGEVATKASPYKGHPVFKMSKDGYKYARPLKLTIEYNGVTYNADQKGSDAPSQPVGNNTETVKPSSYGNGNRGNSRFSHPGSWYGKNIEVWIDGEKVLTVPDGSKRTLGKNGLIWKPISDSNGKLVVVGEHNVKYNSCTIKW